MKQNYEYKTEKIRQAFLQYKKENPDKLKARLKFSWSNWGFGLEEFAVSCERMQRAGISYIELHGNHYGKDLGYRPEEIHRIMDGCGIQVGGICGMFSEDNDLSSNRPVHRQAAIDYIRREAEFTAQVGGKYMLVCPAAVGRSRKYDDSELDRSIDSLSRVADTFVEHRIRAAIEPIRSAETTLVHSIADAKAYIERLDHPGVQHINGDVYHMLVEESHIGEAIMDAGKRLTNLHMADTNRCALGYGSLDIDTIIMALYLLDYNNDESCFVTPEPLGPGGDPYPMQHAKTDPAILDQLVFDSVRYFREREEEVLGMEAE